MITPYDDSYSSQQKDGVVLVGGCFDVLHYGHVTFFKAAKALGRYLMVALEGDEAIVTSKDRRVFHTQHQRAEILESLEMVDEVILLPSMANDEAYLGFVKKVKPHFIAYTAGDPQAHNKEQQAQSVGAKTVVFPFAQGFSTTDLLERYRQ